MVATTKWLRSPHPNVEGKETAAFVAIALGPPGADAVWLLVATGTPVDGVAGTGTGAGYAGIGSLYIDQTAGKMYIQGGTKTTVAWKLVTSA